LRRPQRWRFELGIKNPDIIERTSVTPVSIQPGLERDSVIGRQQTSGLFRQPESGLVVLPFRWFFAQNASSSLSVAAWPPVSVRIATFVTDNDWRRKRRVSA
jgi:hypothetical protein